MDQCKRLVRLNLKHQSLQRSRLCGDIVDYFDTIPHDKRMERQRQKLADGRVLASIEDFLKSGIMDGLEGWGQKAVLAALRRCVQRGSPFGLGA